MTTSTSPRSPIAIIGPTASGKSMVAMELARTLGNIELISVDSMQVYRGMDIGTAKPSMAERSEVAHHAIDLVNPDQEFSLAEFVAVVRRALAEVEARNHRAVLVGGTGLYLRAIIDDLNLPGQYSAVRAELESIADTRSLHARLIALDPMAAARMEPDNRRRIIRALEVTEGSGRPFSSFGPGLDTYPATRFTVYGLASPREVGRERINRRVDQMMSDGLVDEALDLQKHYELSKTAGQALGYREILAAWQTEQTVTDATVETIKARTRSFARRQRVWFQRDPRIKWVEATDPRSAIAEILRELPHQ